MIPLGSMSYPYLAFAQRHQLDYGVVLLTVDAMSKKITELNPHERRAVDEMCLRNLLSTLHRFRRGLNGGPLA